MRDETERTKDALLADVEAMERTMRNLKHNVQDNLRASTDTSGDLHVVQAALSIQRSYDAWIAAHADARRETNRQRCEVLTRDSDGDPNLPGAIGCPVEGCNGCFATHDSLYRHAATIHNLNEDELEGFFN